MGLVAEYEIVCEALPFVEVAAAVPEATLSVELHPSEEWYTAFVVSVVEGPTDAVERAFESTPFVASYDPVERGDGTSRYWVDPAVSMETRLGDHVDDVAELQALAETDASIERIRVTPTGWIQAGWFADRETVDGFRAFWERNAEFDLRRLTPASDGDPGDGLTAPQRAALRTAHRMGYFEVPRAASLDEVAAKLGITASSCSERLRRAQSRLVESTVAAPDLSDG
ncbi:helix-turn-helix domain-containing protein [Halostella salina]|uniref:helix-turn-helix domain-containing protein n=1 Tax=Halostella salina TaxID=1547897 RepID=UPI000EF76387|nr:helix-turn-helix domain-containing protein [Halostella salina]